MLGLLIAVVVLAFHARSYSFLTDDAFISFRYARNLSHGAGLVFNPGEPAVEGYSNFLWVLVLAGLDRLGLAPESVANALGSACTIGLWLLIVAFCWRRAGRGREWLVLIPAFALACSRSFAVWASSGLETRFFELLVIAGVLRAFDEEEALGRGARAAPFAPLWFALASLTRPDGLLISCAVALAIAAWRAAHRRLDLPRLVREWLPFALIVAAHFAFRLAYYHDWLPNTWYAKVGGHSWWSAGWRYLAAFALEYSLWLWLPLIVAAVVLRRRGVGLIALLCAAVIVPHALYVASIGGDHFELLLFEGAAALATGPGATLGTLAYAALAIAASVPLPLDSHREFPSDYRAGFPGKHLDQEDGRAFLDPVRDAIFRAPGLRSIAATHRDLIRYLSTRFIGIRQEEHRLFFESARREAQAVERLVVDGTIPRDADIALDCVGVVPYTTGLRTFDRKGLTERVVARHAPTQELMAHARSATLEEARARGVDLWAVDPLQLVCGLTSPRMMVQLTDTWDAKAERYAADVGDDRFVLAVLPQGLESAQRRMPRLHFVPVADSAFRAPYIARVVAAYQETLRVRHHPEVVWLLGNLIMLGGDASEALKIFESMRARGLESAELDEKIALCHTTLGDRDAAATEVRRALDVAAQSGESQVAARIRERIRLGELPDTTRSPGR